MPFVVRTTSNPDTVVLNRIALCKTIMDEGGDVLKWVQDAVDCAEGISGPSATADVMVELFLVVGMYIRGHLPGQNGVKPDLDTPEMKKAMDDNLIIPG
jgi:hypothetical protein